LELTLNLSYEDILFSIPFPCAVLNSKGEILTVNQKFESLTNKSVKFLKGRKISQFLRCQNIEDALRRSLRENMEIHGLDCGDFVVFISPLFKSSQTVGALLIAKPKLESPFEKDISLFLKGLSHEIKNPLGGINGAARLLLKLKAYDEELVQVIVSEVKRIEGLLKNILKSFDFSNLNVKKKNLNRIVKETFSPLQHRCREIGVNYSLLFDPSLPEIPVDSEKLKQALFNLMKNSIEALEKSDRKELKIETGYAIRPSDFAYIKISDSGIGMDGETLKRFGIPFFTTKEKGTGIGSFIAKEIVKGHGGEILVESSPNRGTTVTILIPMKRKSWQEY
jgi:two-component system nitrogen regulation sensor histidine kinase GlnL